MDHLNLNILVVDDSPIIVRNLSSMLRGLYYNVIETAANGKEAIAKYRACRPDVVTMDITMPIMDGIEATKAIMREFPNAKIVMVTSHGQEKMVLDALKAGARGYVLKPFQQHKLYQAIEKACNRAVLPEKLQSEIEQRTAQREAADKLAAEQAPVQANPVAEPGKEIPTVDQSAG
jgi:two-component system chemotaxis response regulator CheY